MRKIVLFIAMSLDGYIADGEGSVNWLHGQDENAETIDTYSLFIEDIDTVIMGWNTYQQVITELSPTEWPYSHLTSYIITHRDIPSTDNIIFTHKNPCHLVKQLAQKDGKNIWICGGADIIQQLMQENLIDTYCLSIIPTILGNGIRLFGTRKKEITLELEKTQTYNGITELIYERKYWHCLPC